MYILRLYGLGTKLRRLLQSFLDEKTVVPKAGNFYGWHFIM